MSIETSKKKKGIQMPHTYIILFLIVLVVCLLTYVIPAGQFERQEDASGRMLIVPGTYTQVESSPVSPLEIPMAFVRTLGSSSVNEIIFFIFIIGGAFELIMQTGMITAFCAKLGKMFAGKEKLLIPIFITVFAVGGFTMGMSVEVLVFVPIGIAVAKAVGYDTITGTAMIAMGSIVGFTAGIYNPFNVGVAQSIAGVTPMFSGAWYRWIILVAFIVVTSLYIIHYAEKVKKNSSKNLMGNEDSNLEDVDVSAIEVTGRHKLILLAVVIALAVLIYGVAYLGWFITEMATLFLVLGVVCGILAGFSGNKICDLYVQGMANITFGALIVGVAGTINTVMVDGMIIDTIINALANAIVALPSSVKIIGMFLVQTIINLPINSGTGQAAATMPIMAPVGDLVGLTRQSTVLAFQLGDGLTNAIFPTSSTMLGFLAASKIPYSVWLKYVIKLVILLSLVSMAFLALAVVIGY